MKIDESCINHNALRLINEEVSELFEYCTEKPNDDHIRLVTLGEIRGMCLLADALKEALKV